MSMLSIFPYEIMLIVNYAWSQSFVHVETNHTAINEWGWFPYNRNILTYSSIRSTMTIEEIARETTSVAVTVPQRALACITDLTDSNNTPLYDPQFLQITSGTQNESKTKLNLSTSMTAFVLDNIAMETDKHERR